MWSLPCLRGVRRRPDEPVGSKSRRQTTWPEPRPRRLRRADGASEGYSPRPDNTSVLRRIQARVSDDGGPVHPGDGGRRGRWYGARGSCAEEGGRRGGRAAKVLELQGLSRRYGDVVA